MNARYLALLVAIAMLSCSRPAAESRSLTEADVQALRDCVAANVRTALAGDAAAFAALYTEDAMLLPPDGAPVEGRAAIQELFGALTVTAFSSSLVEVEGRDDLAYGRGIHSWTFAAPGAAEPVSESGKWIAIWKRQADGSWLIWRDIWNNNPETD